jgi:hypothetical protein
MTFQTKKSDDIDHNPNVDGCSDYKIVYLESYADTYIVNNNYCVTGPAVIYLKDDMLHREDDLPAIVTPGRQEWYYNGRLHRDNGKPSIIWENGDRDFYNNGVLYCSLGPE